MDPLCQLELLRSTEAGGRFADRLREAGLLPLTAEGVGILQLNITRKCNLACRHCHVQAGPDEALHMNDAVLERCLDVAKHEAIHTVDITGGAPELHPRFTELVEALNGLRKRLLVRSNLVVLLGTPYERLIPFFAANGVELVGSLPGVRGNGTDRQRGKGVFEGIIEAMRRLNLVGYAREGTGLLLDLVHNPAGAYLPGNQAALEADFRLVLRQEHGVEFSHLFCITNCPIGRYLEFLDRSGNLSAYMRDLRSAYNPGAAAGVMCRTMVSVGPDGGVYDCDFNQMLGLEVDSRVPNTIFDFTYDEFSGREIVVCNHCFACTAGAGSSCQGTTA
ncbi:MAG: radical SAM/Cys-rich domain protein [Lentisphaerae bacterium]|jgi:radical SAM/Cys-rich protein|nr:radical SAM/Cys-rich domain protein [Lentisphaerota bacterium]MBT4821179.1 radical SAM/Cys-rich domain protein [Lentisphaerota bacterium]MBT5610840.1 radical SAM/Cys-rich domain protein [Lentisphaerota bacterium]MBT7053728.1 radical SAM/Cys-rich domain protein [Lentisphaerota bacterium]MBT7841189.1 radical SAM/Cys-rich domain protein [Lentisphaerota bacterium]